MPEETVCIDKILVKNWVQLSTRVIIPTGENVAQIQEELVHYKIT